MLKKLWNLFLVFIKLGAFTFGGGYAMIPLIHKEIVTKKQWATEEEMLDMFAIAESTPGVISVNTATFVGYKVAGFWGSLVATFALVTPAFLIISVISLFFAQFIALKWVAYAFSGIRVAVVVLIINAALKLGKVLERNIFNLVMLITAALIAAFTPINPILILIGAMAVGIIAHIISHQKQQKGGKTS